MKRKRDRLRFKEKILHRVGFSDLGDFVRNLGSERVKSNNHLKRNLLSIFATLYQCAHRLWEKKLIFTKNLERLVHSTYLLEISDD